MILSVSGVAVMTAGAECLIAQCLLSTTEEICCHLGCVKSWSTSLVLHTDFSAGPPTCRITHLSACNLRAGAWKKMRHYLEKWLKSCRNGDVTSIRFSDVQVLNFTFIVPYIVTYFYSKTNQMHQFLKFLYFCITLYMFRTVFPSIIRSSRLYIQQQACVKQILLPAASKLARR
jgi:hypothetical protein